MRGASMKGRTQFWAFPKALRCSGEQLTVHVVLAKRNGPCQAP